MKPITSLAPKGRCQRLAPPCATFHHGPETSISLEEAGDTTAVRNPVHLNSKTENHETKAALRAKTEESTFQLDRGSPDTPCWASKSRETAKFDAGL